MTTTLGEMFPGNMGRVLLTRVSIKLRMPELLKLPNTEPLSPELHQRLADAVIQVKKG